MLITSLSCCVRDSGILGFRQRIVLFLKSRDFRCAFTITNIRQKIDVASKQASTPHSSNTIKNRQKSPFKMSDTYSDSDFEESCTPREVSRDEQVFQELERVMT